MNNYIDNVISNYYIENISKIEAINKGNTSNAIYILSDNGEWILRKLKDKNQGISEYTISNILINDSICPEIITTKSNVGYSYYQGKYYNLQQYIKPDTMKNDIETFKVLGRTLGILHNKLKDNMDIVEQEDRFSLKELWKQCKNKCSNVEKHLDYLFSKTSDIESFIDEMCSAENVKTTFIHGDLGKWNLINASKKIYIIDFGEARRGDNHFDIAAVLTSMMNFDFGNDFAYKCLCTFYESYISYMNNFQWESLQKNIHLWILRGILALFLYSNDEVNFIKRAKKMMDLKINFDEVISDNFM